jgi:hypothetical protein
MTVGELRTKLEQYPDDMKVFVDVPGLLSFSESAEFSSRVRLCFPFVTRVKDDKVVQRPTKSTKGAKAALVL